MTIARPRGLEPFWSSMIMEGEALFFVEGRDAFGTDRPAARLLFPPEQILSLTSADGEIAYEADRDFIVDHDSGLVSLPSGSRIPFTTIGELYPLIDPNQSAVMHRRDDRTTCLLFSDDIFHQRQMEVSYTHRADLWHGYRPVSAARQMPRSCRLLRDQAPLTLCVTGDSISEGYNASGFMHTEPYQAPYGGLVATGLEAAYGSPIIYQNDAVAGWSADNGVWDAERVGATGPDLVIIAYGMNDAGYCNVADYAANVAAIMGEIRRQSPATEFVLVSSMLPHPEWDYPDMARFPAYRDALAGLCGPGAALADLTALWTDLLERKSPLDLTGNGVNHPNDFGHRLYAQVVLALFGATLDVSR